MQVVTTESDDSKRFAFDPSMSHVDLSSILKLPPFAQIDFEKFPQGEQSVAQILKQDSRVRHFASGDVILRHGEFSNCAFIVLRGKVQTVLEPLLLHDPIVSLDRSWSVWQRLVASVSGGGNSLARKSAQQTRQKLVQQNDTSKVSVRGDSEHPQLYLNDIDAIIHNARSEPLIAGKIFGELAAMTRSANEYSVVALTSTTVLEIRWQGLRQLRRDDAFRNAIDTHYRQSSLQTWLSAHKLLQYCPPEAIEKIANSADLVSYGQREWYVQYNQTKQATSTERIESEPLICNEGEHASSLIFVRSGFARQSFRYSHSHRTVQYLSTGETFGLQEIFHNAKLKQDEDPLPLQHSLRALGYLDVIRIDRKTVLDCIVPYVRIEHLHEPINQPRLDAFARVEMTAIPPLATDPREEPLQDFIVHERLLNATSAMVINTDRCTRCDDCIRACATSHGGVTRFTRTGPTIDNFQFVHACMHCVDPVCMIGCPTGAIGRDTASGNVSINAATCIGCKTCAQSCPYDNIVMEILDQTASSNSGWFNLRSLSSKPSRVVEDNLDNAPMVASKCDLCTHLPSGPACVSACPHEALERVDLSDMNALRDWLAEQ